MVNPVSVRLENKQVYYTHQVQHCAIGGKQRQRMHIILFVLFVVLPIASKDIFQMHLYLLHLVLQVHKGCRDI